MEEEIIEKDMTPVLLEDLGMRFATEKSKHKARYGLYVCQYCGKDFECLQQNVKKGQTKSCGCQSQGHRNPHGLSHHPLYFTWTNMRRRCYNPKAQYYKDYGGRGIQVCERWLDIENFIEDMYPTFKEGLTLDRINVGGNYEPDNCRWTTQNIQCRNTRDIGKNNKSGYRGTSWNKKRGKWVAQIKVNNRQIYIGLFHTASEAAKAYERYVRVNNLEHNFTPALTEEEIEELYRQKEENEI